jgi:hypothetical protein
MEQERAPLEDVPLTSSFAVFSSSFHTASSESSAALPLAATTAACSSA